VHRKSTAMGGEIKAAWRGTPRSTVAHLLRIAKYSDELFSYWGRLARCGVGILPARGAGAGRSRDSGQDARATPIIVTRIRLKLDI